MEHITRCPHCATIFRVTEGQLAAHQGKVRCGRCAFVFNALDALLDHSPAGHTGDDAPENGSVTDPVPPAPVQPQTSSPWLSADAYPATTDSVHTESTVDTPPTEPISRFSALSDQEIPAAESDDTPGGYRPITTPEDDALFAPLQKPRHAIWWTVGAILAGLVLILQIVFAYRVTLAMEYPALQVRFNSLCATLGCKMPLPHQAERLRLEWSELTFIPDHPNLIQLTATLRNLAPFEQALPMMELTLTDTQERIVARRVFSPKEYLASTESTRQSLLGYDELHAFVQIDVGSIKSTGYSLYWFY